MSEVNAGVQKPKSFILDASVLDYKEQHEIFREDVKQNKIRYTFPLGVNTLDLMEECRALASPDDFDLLFDITMQMLVGKTLRIEILVDPAKDEYQKACEILVTDVYQNLRANPFINEYPTVILWLTEFMSEYLLKKYPVPGKELVLEKPEPAPEKPKGRFRVMKTSLNSTPQ